MPTSNRIYPTISGVQPSQQTFAGIQTPAVKPAVSAGPLDVSNFFRANQQLISNRALDLQEARLRFDQQRQLFDYTKNLFNTAFGQSLNSRTQSNQANYGLDNLFPVHNEISTRLNGTLQKAQEEAFNLALSAQNSPRGLSQETARRISNTVAKAREGVFSDPEYMKYARRHRAYNDMLVGIKAEVDSGKEISPSFQNFIMKYQNSLMDRTAPEPTLAEFNPKNYVIDTKYSREQLDGIIKGALNDTKYSELIELERGATGEQQGQIQRERNKALSIAKKAISSDPDVYKYLSETGTLDQFGGLDNYISNQLDIQGRDDALRKTINNIEKLTSENKNTTTTSTGEEVNTRFEGTDKESLNAARWEQEIKDKGYNPYDADMSEIRSIEKAYQDDLLEVFEGDERLIYYRLPENEKIGERRVIVEFDKTKPVILPEKEFSDKQN